MEVMEITLQTFVLDSGAVSSATSISEQAVTSYTFTETRTVVAIELSIMITYAGAALGANDYYDGYMELTPQASGLKEGTLGRLDVQFVANSYVADPTAGQVANPNTMKNVFIVFPSDARPVYDKGDVLNLIIAATNATPGSITMRAYAIVYYI